MQSWLSGRNWRNDLPRREMGRPNTKAIEYPGKVDFDIHGVVGIRLIDPSPSDLGAACKLLGCPSKMPLIAPDITVQFLENLPTLGRKFLGPDQAAFIDHTFFFL